MSAEKQKTVNLINFDGMPPAQVKAAEDSFAAKFPPDMKELASILFHGTISEQIASNMGAICESLQYHPRKSNSTRVPGNVSERKGEEKKPHKGSRKKKKAAEARKAVVVEPEDIAEAKASGIKAQEEEKEGAAAVITMDENGQEKH